MKVSTVQEMRALDRYAIEQLGIPEEILMENAGIASSIVIQNEFGVQDRKFVVLCGIGNNGGDGLVIARKIHSNGAKVKVFILGDATKFKGAALLNFQMASKLSIDIQEVKSLASVKNEIVRSDAVVDAMFGTGLDRDVDGIFKNVIRLINESKKPVFSLDIPSGVNGNTGQIMGSAVKADFTITYGLPKIGNMLYPGYDYCGKLYVSHISFPPSLYNADSLKIALNDPIPLPSRAKAGHKGDFGEVLFIAGARNYFGAPYFASMSFLKSGGGYARLALPKSMTASIAKKGKELVFMPQEETDSGSISLKNMDALLALSEKMDMVVIGPGMSLNEETQQLVRELAVKIKKPLLIDGDGITAVSRDLEVIRKRKAKTILTPHLGEMVRITGVSPTEIDKNKINILQKTCQDLDVIIVLKGAHSLIGYPDGKVFVNLSGNSGMATAGSGDVLAGAIAAMHGLGLSIEDAARKGVFVHGLAGDLAVEKLGQDGITAEDILKHIANAMKTERNGLCEYLQENYRVKVL
jgi:NAD(P)H-hydrate epimerase